MLKSLKKMLVLIPCMIFGLFLLNSASVFAAGDMSLIGATKIIIGDGNDKENTYYFTNSYGWEFKADVEFMKDYFGENDTYVTYRVVRPDGAATAESSKIKYVNNGWSFNIPDVNKLSYVETEDMSKRVTEIPAGTYFVDLKFYGALMFGAIKWEQKDAAETLKIVVGADDEFGVPTANITYNSTAKKYTLDAAVLKDGKGYSLIESVDYYFSQFPVENEISTFRSNMEESAAWDQLNFKQSQISLEIDTPETGTYNHLYVMVTTANGYSKIVSYDVTQDQPDVDGDQGNNENIYDNTNNNDNGDGLWDYGFGELILLVLVIVLIVSCALIITQKIVDYKKRLY